MQLVKLVDGEARTTTLAIAEGTGVEHASVIKLVRNYTSDFEEFGRVDLKSLRQERGGHPIEIAFLNQEQATLAMTYMRNSEIVRAFKKKLVKAFYDILQQGKVEAPTTFKDALKLAYEQQCLIEEQSLQITQMIPKAEFYDTVTKSDQWEDMQTVAKTINFVGVGRNKLFDILRNNKVLMSSFLTRNFPYQSFVDQGYFKIVESTYTKDEKNLVGKKTVVSQRGIEFIAKLLRKLGYYTADEVSLRGLERIAA